LLHQCWGTILTFFVAFGHTGNEKAVLKASLRPSVHRALYEGVYNTLWLY
jgi:hypothetical protein